MRGHYPLPHKLGVVRTLYERADNIIMEPEDQKQETIHVNNALRVCGYPDWSFKEVRKRMDNRMTKTQGQSNKRRREERSRRKKIDKRRLW